MAVNSVADLCGLLRQREIVEPVRHDELELLAATHADAKAFLKDLVDRGLLTAWQAEVIEEGRDSELQIGSYLLLERLGEGGMGVVYKARHLVMGRIVALKVIRRERLIKAEAVRRFQREIQLAARISHPNVVLAYDADRFGDLHFFAMEFVSGIDLGRLVRKRGPLPVDEACEYVRQAALGLQHAHDCGLVHRDIKPANLVLTLAKGEALRASLSGVLSGMKLNSLDCFQGVIKIMDLGLARLQELDDDGNRITLEGLIVGTPDFLAPEQARHSSSVDARADIYGLGGTLFFLLTARLPFPDGTPTEKILKHATFPVPDVKSFRPDVPSELAALAHKMMAKAPKDRVQTAAEVASALERFSLEAALPIPMRERTIPAEPRPIAKWASRGWIWRIVLGLAAVCLIGGGIGLVLWAIGI